jgi:hypothetical protein
MHATAPKKPGIYHSRWRLRDYSKESGSQGFGPKVDFALEVKNCQPKACGCRVSCSNGKNELLTGYDIDSNELCKSVAVSYCKPADYVAHSYEACPALGDANPVGGGGDTGGDPSGGGAGGSDPGGAGGSDPGGAGGSDPGGAGGTDVDDPTNEWITEDPSDMDVIEPEDDPDFEDDGFQGYDPPSGTSDNGGCSIGAVHPSADLDFGVFGLAAAAMAVWVMRRRSEQR